MQEKLKTCFVIVNIDSVKQGLPGNYLQVQKDSPVTIN